MTKNEMEVPDLPFYKNKNIISTDQISKFKIIKSDFLPCQKIGLFKLEKFVTINLKKFHLLLPHQVVELFLSKKQAEPGRRAYCGRL